MLLKTRLLPRNGIFCLTLLHFPLTNLAWVHALRMPLDRMNNMTYNNLENQNKLCDSNASLIIAK